MKRNSINHGKLTEEGDIINIEPHWVIRNGNWLFLFLLIFLVFLSWLIKVPLSAVAEMSKTDGRQSLTLTLSEKNIEGLRLKANRRILVHIPAGQKLLLSGSVNSIRKISDSSYTVSVDLQENLKKLPFEPVSAVSIIHKERLLSVLWNQIRF